MSYRPISATAMQYQNDNDKNAVDYWLKFYIANDTTPIPMATNDTGAPLLDKCKLNDEGYPISNKLENSSIFIPYIDQAFRFVLYRSEAEADANDTASAAVNIPEVYPIDRLEGAVNSVATIAGLPTNAAYGQKVSVNGYHTGTLVGGGEMTFTAGRRHDGGMNIDPTRTFPTDWADPVQVAAWFADSGVDADCFVRNGALDASCENFGMIADAAADDSYAIQATLTYSYLNQANFTGSRLAARISKTLYVGNYSNSSQPITIDFKGLNLKPDASVSPALSSGKYSAGTWSSAMSEALNAYNSFQTVFKNLKVEWSADATKDGKTAVELKDFHYGCEIRNVAARNWDTAIKAVNCFGAEFDSCTLINTDPFNRRGIGFLFEADNNLMKLSRMQSLNTGTGYQIDGGITAFVFDNCSFEGQKKGLVCTSEVFDLQISNCYLENIEDTFIVFEAKVNHAVFENNYVNNINYPAAYLFDYLPAPTNNIIWRPSNWIFGIADDHLFKVVDTTDGYNEITWEEKPKTITSIDDLYVDNANFPPGLVLDQVLQSSYKSKIVNRYAEGQYAGRFSNGRDNSAGNGFEWVNESSSTMNLRTKMTASTSARIYVSLRISGGSLGLVRGELVGDTNVTGNMDFYEYTATGLDKTNIVTVSQVDGFFHLHYTHVATITAVVGEVRLC